MTNPSKELILHERVSESCYVVYSLANRAEWRSNFTRKSWHYLMSFWIHCLNETLYTRSDGLDFHWNVLLRVKSLDDFYMILPIGAHIVFFTIRVPRPSAFSTITLQIKGFRFFFKCIQFNVLDVLTPNAKLKIFYSIQYSS